ncbi:hypothetical protein WMO79_04030 [Micrococcaceae bacterium Sec7.4]
MTAIPKNANFRSDTKIVEFLNQLRPELKQAPARDVQTEDCDHTLGSYIAENNGKPSFDSSKRKQIAQQFLYGIRYLAVKGFLQVKRSDFGLHKTQISLLTRTGTEMKGTILDPAPDDFKNYSLANEIYSVGHVVSFIFTGGRHLMSEARTLAQSCVAAQT